MSKVPTTNSINEGKSSSSSSSSSKNIFHGRGLDLNNNFREWWSEARKSEEPPTPYEFLTNFGIIGDAVSHTMMEMFWTMLFNSPSHAGQPDYYAYYLKDALKTVPTGYRDFKSLYPSTGDPDSLLDRIDDCDHYVMEQDIKSLLQVASPLENDLTRCIQRDYSLDLVNCIFEKTSEGSELNLNFDAAYKMANDRQVLDKSLMLIIQKHIGKIKSIECFDDGDGDDEFLWTKDAFAQFLGMMMQSEGPSKIEMNLPEKFCTDLDGGNAMDLRQALPEKKVVSSIEDLTICLSNKMEALNLAVLELVPRMAALKELVVTVGPHIKSAAPYLVQSLQSATVLENLFIYNGLKIDDPHVCADSLLAILEALRTNTSLVKFRYQRYEKESGMDLYESKILDVLKLDNSTLQCVKVGVYGHSDMTFVKAVREKVDYYLTLNRHGRQQAREPELQLADFIALLGDVNEKLVTGLPVGERVDDTEALNVLFGLLQERPGFWTETNSSVDASISTKRKCSNQESGKQKQQKVT